MPQANHFVDVLSRVVRLAASAGSDAVAIEQILGEMRAASVARHTVLVGKDHLPHRAS
jgi:hypothetical protein